MYSIHWCQFLSCCGPPTALGLHCQLHSLCTPIPGWTGLVLPASPAQWCGPPLPQNRRTGNHGCSGCSPPLVPGDFIPPPPLRLIPQDIITEMIKKNPHYKPPADYRPERKFRKIMIPQQQHPGYNFIGLIIGPRGNTQKRMERETGCKVGRGVCVGGRGLRGRGPGIQSEAGSGWRGGIGLRRVFLSCQA